MYKWRCCSSEVSCWALWYWQLRRKFNAILSYSYSHLFGHIRSKGRKWIRSSYIKLYLGNIIWGDVIYILLKSILNFGGSSSFRYDGKYWSPFTKSHGVSSRTTQASHTHTHTPLSKQRGSIKIMPVYSRIT